MFSPSCLNIALLAVVSSLFMAALGLFLCSLAKQAQPSSHLFYIPQSDHLLNFRLEENLGMTIEQRLAFGKQLVFLLTPKGLALAEVLRAGNYRVAELKGQTRDGFLTILCVEIPRLEAKKLIRIASAVDEQCVVIVNDIRRSDLARRIDPKGNERKSSWFSPPGRPQSSKVSLSQPAGRL